MPDLPGCVAVGESRAEVERLIRETIEFTSRACARTASLCLNQLPPPERSRSLYKSNPYRDMPDPRRASPGLESRSFAAAHKSWPRPVCTLYDIGSWTDPFEFILSSRCVGDLSHENEVIHRLRGASSTSITEKVTWDISREDI